MALQYQGSGKEIEDEFGRMKMIYDDGYIQI